MAYLLMHTSFISKAIKNDLLSQIVKSNLYDIKKWKDFYDIVSKEITERKLGKPVLSKFQASRIINQKEILNLQGEKHDRM